MSAYGGKMLVYFVLVWNLGESKRMNPLLSSPSSPFFFPFPFFFFPLFSLLSVPKHEKLAPVDGGRNLEVILLSKLPNIDIMEQLRERRL